jgi:transcriptional regulator with XRE-family HTH domain
MPPPLPPNPALDLAINELREARDLTQEELASRAGMKLGTVIRITHLNPSGGGCIRAKLAASTKRRDIRTRTTWRGPALELRPPEHLHQLVNEQRGRDEDEAAVPPCCEEATRPSLGISDERRDEDARVYDGTDQAGVCARRTARTSATAGSSAASGARVPWARASSRARRPRYTNSASSTTWASLLPPSSASCSRARRTTASSRIRLILRAAVDSVYRIPSRARQAH